MSLGRTSIKSEGRGAFAGVAVLAIACSTAEERSATQTPGPGRGPEAGMDGAMDSGMDRRMDSGIPPISIPEGGARDGATGPCKNLECQQVACPDGGTTSVTGVVYAPDGRLPIYNAVVYVPNATLPAIPAGLSCDRCGTVPGGEPVAITLSDHRGAFVLNDVPIGSEIPLVIQVGKWRRQVAIPEVRRCEENRIADPQLTRLPRRRSEGDMPRIAVTTGRCDNLICLIAKLGIDPSEWGVAGEDKVVTFFSGNAVAPFPDELLVFGPELRGMTRATELWNDWNELRKYDMSVLSCECEEALEIKNATALQNMTRYLEAGGRLFSTDLQYAWYKYSPNSSLQSVAQIGAYPAAAGEKQVELDTSFPKGKALADWFANLRPSEPYGKVSCSEVWDNFRSASPPAAQVWGVSAAAPETQATGALPRFVTINTPVGVPAEQQCGRAVHLDAHITSTFTRPINRYPADCGTEFEPGEEVLAFFFFDLAACIQDDRKPPTRPPIR
jgi:hypothetical protein